MTLPPICDANTFLQPDPNLESCLGSCPDGSWPHQIYRTCVDCPVQCATCQGPENTDCNTCINGYWIEASPGECQLCPTECDECTSASVCQSCASNHYLLTSSDSCIPVCPAGFWPDEPNRVCQDCPSECAECSDASTCQSCVTNYHLFSSSNTCLATCPTSYWPDGSDRACKVCPSECLECSDAFVCQSCVVNYFHWPPDSSCITTCPPKFYGDTGQNRCLGCHSSCEECYGLSNEECISCFDGFFLLFEINKCSLTCSEPTYPDINSKKCLSYAQLSALIDNLESSFNEVSIDCPTCSEAGYCEHFEEYQEERCICKPKRVGPSCAYAEAEVNSVLDRKLALVSLISRTFRPSQSSQAEIDAVSEYLGSLTEGPTISSALLLTKSIESAQEILEELSSGENYSNKLTKQALVSLLGVASNSLDVSSQQDCLLNKNIAPTVYNQSVDLIQLIGRANTKRVAASPSSAEAVLENARISMYTNRMTLKELSDGQTSLTHQDDQPAFILEYDLLSSTGSTVDLDEEVDVQAVLWKDGNPFYCPNETDSTTVPNVNIDIFNKGTNTTHPITEHTRLRLFYPPNAGTTCQTGCSRVHGSGLIVECLCDKLSEQSLKHQILNVFERSNLRKLSNLSALKDFNVAKAAVFWILLVLFTTTSLYSLVLRLKKKEKKQVMTTYATQIRFSQRSKGVGTIILVTIIHDFQSDIISCGVGWPPTTFIHLHRRQVLYTTESTVDLLLPPDHAHDVRLPFRRATTQRNAFVLPK